MATKFPELLQELEKAGVEFIVIGGVAARAHGSARFTEDLDVVYRRTEGNIERLVNAFAPQKPYLRGAPPGLPFVWDARTIKRGLNFTLTTSLGSIDLLGEVTGGGGFDDLLPHTVTHELFGVNCRLLNLASLIKVKRAAGRPKDIEAVAELEAILEEAGQNQNTSSD